MSQPRFFLSLRIPPRKLKICSFIKNGEESRRGRNRNEIIGTIKEAFNTGLDIDKEQLTREAKFSWA